MNTRTYASHRRAGNGPLFIAGGIVLVALIGGALLLHAGGVIDLPFLSSSDKDKATTIDRTGRVPVVMTVRPVEAYARVSREHVLNPKSMRIAVFWMMPEEIPEGAARSAAEVLGRVIKHNKPAGQIFMLNEFFPKDTRPGPTAGIPPGKRAMRLKASDVPGLHGLQQGDHFDIVMTIEVEIEKPRAKPMRRDEKLEIEGPYAPLAQADAAPQEAPTVKRRVAEVTLVVEDGVVVQPVHKREEITQKGSLLRGTQLERKPIEELIIAVEPHEVAELNRARAIEANLQVAMRSGRVPEDGHEVDHGRIPDLKVEIEDPAPVDPDATTPTKGRERVRIVEVIVGGKKVLRAVPIPESEDGENDGEEK